MSGNLSARLKRIREAGRAGGPEKPAPAGQPATAPRFPAAAALEAAGWREAESGVLHRALFSACAALPAALHPAFSILCPAAGAAFADGRPLPCERLLLFDLETTGLSGGAGTVAFLAAFGRFELVAGGPAVLRIDQYLLLDYPGEESFLRLVTKEFAGEGAERVLGSYNGRSFDMQILRTRCIMNGMAAPDPVHLDLVHAARRLWRKRLPSCSLADIEIGVLGLDRGDDLPGSEAPDAWFDFLKTGAAGRLAAVCEHNKRDLEGLAALLVRMDEVARDPLAAAAAGAADAEGLALRWLAAASAAAAAVRRALAAAGRSAGADAEEVADAVAALERAALELLEAAAADGSARSAAALAGLLGRKGEAERAAELRRRVAESADPALGASLRAAACASLATDALRRLADPTAALAWIDRALSLEGLAPGRRAQLERRRERIVNIELRAYTLPS